MAISDEKLAQFYAECPKLERYRRYLTNLAPPQGAYPFRRGGKAAGVGG